MASSPQSAWSHISSGSRPHLYYIIILRALILNIWSSTINILGFSLRLSDVSCILLWLIPIAFFYLCSITKSWALLQRSALSKLWPLSKFITYEIYVPNMFNFSGAHLKYSLSVLHWYYCSSSSSILASSPSWSNFIVKVKVDPTPNSDSKEILPPNLEVICSEITRPNPIPCVFI